AGLVVRTDISLRLHHHRRARGLIDLPHDRTAEQVARDLLGGAGVEAGPEGLHRPPKATAPHPIGCGAVEIRPRHQLVGALSFFFNPLPAPRPRPPAPPRVPLVEPSFAAAVPPVARPRPPRGDRAAPPAGAPSGAGPTCSSRAVARRSPSSSLTLAGSARRTCMVRSPKAS